MGNEVSVRDFSILHDAEINSISILNEREDLSLNLILCSGGQCSIVFCSVKAVRIIDFVMQNVVSRVKNISQNSLSDKEIMGLVTRANSFSDFDVEMNDADMLNWLNKIRGGEWGIFVVEPSRGADVIVISEKIELVMGSS